MIYEKNDPVKLSEDGAIEIIDQRLLPNTVKTLRLHSADEFAEAIRTLAVRGAPCLGIFTGYAFYAIAKRHEGLEWEMFRTALKNDVAKVVEARPTAVNPRWAAERMKAVLGRAASVGEAVSLLKEEAETIHEEEIATCRIISEFGLTLIHDGDSVITHCNAGALATSRYGTGLGPLLLGAERGCSFHAYVDETRPLLQGSRLTAYELMNAGIDTTVMCDNMASYLMASRKINACLVGCDRVAANGDAANKIGTSGLAVIAKHYGVPFYVFCPFSTIDLGCKSGADIEIEMREGEEIGRLYFEKPMAPKGAKFLNPAFDVTPSELITAIVTERGIFYPPYDLNIQAGTEG